MSDVDPRNALLQQCRLLQEQLGKIDQQVEDRRATSRHIMTQLKEQLETYQAAKNHPEALIDQSGEKDFHRAQEYVQRLIRQTKQQIADEEVACWNDIQRLNWERRELEREKARLDYSLRLLQGGENDA